MGRNSIFLNRNIKHTKNVDLFQNLSKTIWNGRYAKVYLGEYMSKRDAGKKNRRKKKEETKVRKEKSRGEKEENRMERKKKENKIQHPGMSW